MGIIRRMLSGAQTCIECCEVMDREWMRREAEKN